MTLTVSAINKEITGCAISHLRIHFVWKAPLITIKVTLKHKNKAVIECVRHKCTICSNEVIKHETQRIIWTSGQLDLGFRSWNFVAVFNHHINLQINNGPFVIFILTVRTFYSWNCCMHFLNLEIWSKQGSREIRSDVQFTFEYSRW